jgi:soluble lytic murein transglycosylase-like protein
MILQLGVLALIGICGYELAQGTTSNNTSEGNSVVVRNNKWSLPDIDSTDQQGGYDTTYDESFEKASAQTGVPFALIKAHAIRESSLKPNAYHFDNSSEASFGLLQVEWGTASSIANRLSKYGPYSADQLRDGSILYDPDTSAYLGACIIRDNLDWLKGNLRDAINAYNTGHAESGGEAPANYVDDVLTYYGKIIGEVVS